jgi:hypothetical protein
MNSEISDNLDLRAVASIFETLEIFKILNDGWMTLSCKYQT